MKQCYGKRDVSNWTLTFDNGEDIYIDTVNTEEITYCCNGKIGITIKDCLIRPELLHLLKRGTNINHVKQDSIMRNAEDGENYDFVDEFDNLVISYANLHGAVGELQYLDIILNSR